MFPAYSVEAQAPGVQGYASILLVTVIRLNYQSFLVRFSPVWYDVARCGPFRLVVTPTILVLSRSQATASRLQVDI